MNAIYLNDIKGLHKVPYATTTQRYNANGIAVMANTANHVTRMVRLVFKHGYFVDLTTDDTVNGKYIVDDSKVFNFGYYTKSKFEIPYFHTKDAKNQILRSCSDDLQVTPELNRSLWHYYLLHKKIDIPESLSTALRILCLAAGFNLKWCGGVSYRITRSHPRKSKVVSIHPLSVVGQILHIYTIHADDSISSVGYQGLLIH